MGAAVGGDEWPEQAGKRARTSGVEWGGGGGERARGRQRPAIVPGEIRTAKFRDEQRDTGAFGAEGLPPAAAAAVGSLWAWLAAPLLLTGVHAACCRRSPAAPPGPRPPRPAD
uniref:Uncharacterized protein n=1 Tax=Oryza sativa subsp. japonica TaxID=39947 RepID=Q6EP97_ORYSJ|nr:hypothetical protein [Oryza sativa Japonica Group]BAD29523.1 hypothetical protein [Oryza sativa Japonica Group]